VIASICMPFAKGTPKPPGSGRKKKPAEPPELKIEQWAVERLKPYERNPRKNDKAVPRMVASIREYGFVIPVLARSSGEVIDGHLRLKAAHAAKLASVPVIVCDAWTEAQVKAFRLMVNRSVAWAEWDMDALALEFGELKAADLDLTLTGFDAIEWGDFSGMAAAGAAGNRGEGSYIEQFGVIVICEGERQQREIYERLVGEGLTCRVVVT